MPLLNGLKCQGPLKYFRASKEWEVLSCSFACGGKWLYHYNIYRALSRDRMDALEISLKKVHEYAMQ
ncbi:hypothetical protein CER18_01275 [Bartonella tribocorum]|uniref:Uncharacterized protein n=1 Tax=Bartonella tribocorum TaxID=85701 RepID=A0A2M6UUX0_9HYPH|nr:hypothetical protein CER18_01275 [Bartonella tribocorum]